MGFDPRLLIALVSSIAMALLTAGLMRWRRRRQMRTRVKALAEQWSIESEPRRLVPSQQTSSLTPRLLVGQVGARLADRMPDQVGALATRLDRAGVAGRVTTSELLGWKAAGVSLGVLVGLASTVQYGTLGVLVLIMATLIGWFGIDVVLARYHSRRRREILRDLPTVMDLLVLSLEAGMGLDRALRTVVHEYRSALSHELRRVLSDVDLGISRSEAFDRLAARVGLEDLRLLSRAIIQSEELGVSLVAVMQTQGREVRLSRRRAAEAEAMRAPIKMLIPLVVFILPTLFMLLLGPVALRTGAAMSGMGGP